MDRQFELAYKNLNSAQKEAVDTIDGPVLVVAGPGTGKTQLLSLRVANILRRTDAAPSNILCLTFTDNATRNMRDRLQSIIGQPAYHVAIHTFHSFGGEIISQYADFFDQRRLMQHIDELGRYQLMQEIFETLPHDNPLSAKVGSDYIFLKDTLNVISWLKQNALTPDELRSIIHANQVFMDEVGVELAAAFAAPTSPKQLSAYQALLKSIQKQTAKQIYSFADYAGVCATELERAIDNIPESGRYAPSMTVWRNAWCQKDAEGKHVFKDAGRNLRKMYAVAGAYQKLIDRMAEQGLYDFDDMIVEVVHALESSDELRFNLQERYQYILVDEFQDTNKAQLRLLNSLGNNEINEGRPNIMAVGDDDQAIYAFQGAATSNMASFVGEWREPKLVTLTDNYRSTPEILEASASIANQIDDRLENIIEASHKQLQAKQNYSEAKLEHAEFVSELAQYDWIAEQVDQLIKAGTAPEQIGIIAPRHRYLERLIPYLGQRQLPVSYERRENILESPIIVQLVTMARLVVALVQNQQAEIDALFAEVLGYEFWGLPTEAILQISLDSYNQHAHWLALLTAHQNKSIAAITNWFVGLAKHSRLEPLEYMLDQLVGGISEGVDSEYDELVSVGEEKQPAFISPLRNFYFSPANYEQATDIYLALLGQLSTLRQHLRQWKPEQTLYIQDLIEFVQLHLSANLKIIDNNPHTQTVNAVQVMTAYKAKGLEFDVVFVINSQDEIWGPTARSHSPSISLPKNLPIAPAGDTNNDKLRLFFVALTRARHDLYITGYQQNLDNKLSAGLSFMINDQAEPLHAAFNPIHIKKPITTKTVEILTTDWAYRVRQIMADKTSLFEPILENYKLSVTHLNNFLDIVGAGPEYFLLHNLLRFPEAPTPSAAYGDAIHKSLQWTQLELKQNATLPTLTEIQNYFSDVLDRKQLRVTDHKRLKNRGLDALQIYFNERGGNILASDAYERSFSNEGVVINGAHLSGKIDKLHFTEAGRAEVVDFKTGKPAATWQGKDEYEKVKLHKYHQQLIFYKLLVENSASFSNKLTVSIGALEFIETNDRDKLVPNLELLFGDDELNHLVKLIGAVWQHIINLNFPDTNDYPKNMRGIKQFEDDLINGTI